MKPTLSQELHTLLKKYWGYDAFRPQQEAIIESIILKNDTAVLMPTGGGKSLCYQLPALYSKGICLVVSPLIALMQDQVEQLHKRGIAAEAIHSSLSFAQIEVILNRCLYGDLSLLYVSPERLTSDLFLGHLERMPIQMLAVDEAHCISQWGNDFRPEYRHISEVRELLPHVPIIALTATATPLVLKDIQTNLAFVNGRVFQTGFSRPNLIYRAYEEPVYESKRNQLHRLFKLMGGSAIVYARTRREVEELADDLLYDGISATYYHAGLSSEERQKRQYLWTRGEVRVVVATNAFGMGIDKPDVRVVVHISPPDSLEAYFQEAGRAGRDGKEAYAILLYDQADINLLRFYAQKAYPERAFMQQVYRAVFNYFHIPLGSGNEVRKPFDFVNFCKENGFDNAAAVMQALKIMQRAGFWHLTEEPQRESRLWIMIARETLYAYARERQNTYELVDILLRTYTGILDGAVVIREELLAKRTGIPLEKIEETLWRMHKEKVVEYEQRSPFPELIICSSRIHSRDIYLPPAVYDEARKQYQKRIEHVIAYLQCPDCRVKYILQYFGEESADCMTCDRCLLKKKAKTPSKATALQHGLMDETTERTASLSDIKTDFLQVERQKLVGQIRRLCDHDQLVIENKSSFHQKQAEGADDAARKPEKRRPF